MDDELHASEPLSSHTQSSVARTETGKITVDGELRYCMRCGKHIATHLKIGTHGRKQYRCDACFKGKTRP